MKKFISRTLALFLLVGSGTLFSVFFDPYGIFHPESHRSYQSLEPNKRFIKATHYLKYHEQYQTLLFGSSRVGAIDVTQLDPALYGNAYNMTYSGGTPLDHLEDLRYFAAQGKIPATVIIGIDESSVHNIFQDTQSFLLRRPYPYQSSLLEFYLPYLNPTMGIRALFQNPANFKIMLCNTRNEALYTHGCTPQFMNDPLDYFNISAEEYAKRDDFFAIPLTIIPQENFKSALNHIMEIKDLCDANGVKLIVFTNPVHYTRFIYGGNSGLMDFLGEIQKNIDFYNFIGINDITTDNTYYFETIHYSRRAGDYIYRVLNGERLNKELEAQYFSVKTNDDNIIPMLNEMEESIDTFLDEDDDESVEL